MVKVKAASQNEAAFSASAAASSITSVKVTFTKAVDADSVTKDSFKFADETVAVETAELSADGLTADLTIAGALYDKSYEMTVTGVKVAGAVQDDQKVTFKTPEATELYPASLTPADEILKADGASTTNVTFKITDKDGNPLKEKVEVEFTATMGKFAEQRVTVKSDGTAENMYTSEARATRESAILTARIVEASSTALLKGREVIANITLDPNPSLIDTSVGAIITSAEAETADRVIAYFNKEVDAKDFQTAEGYMDTKKFDVRVESGLDNGFTDGSGTQHDVVGILGVDGNEKALQLLVATPLQDNSNVKVTFEDTRNTESKVSARNSVPFKLTDARQPSVLSVDNDGQQKIVIEFSEAVLPYDLAGSAAQRAELVADVIKNYKIDGRTLDTYKVDDKKGYTTNKDTAPDEDDVAMKSHKEVQNPNAGNGSVTVGTFRKGKDNRNIVTITLGDGYPLAAGTHSLQVSNVGDWAAKTDLERNIVNTQTFDFVVEAENTKPTFEVEVQSPEQYLVKFNSSVKLVNSSDRLTTEDSSSADKSILKLQRQDGSSWVTVSDDAWASLGDKKNNVRITRVYDDENAKWTDEYLVEVRNDWTKVYNTTRTNRNYYNDTYRLFIEKGKLYNSANSEKNDDWGVVLDGAMKEPDNTSPEISDIVQVMDPETGRYTSYYNVTMSEPVKLTDGSQTGVKGANAEGLTPSETQQSVPVPLVQFIKSDNHSVTIDGVVRDDKFIDAYDKIFRVKPKDALGAGDWDVAVRAVTDDYGNTVSTKVGHVRVEKEEAQTGFEIVWAAVSTTPNYDDITNGYGSYIFVKFNKAVSLTGGSANALNTANYTLNGKTLPTGTDIKADIIGYDDKQDVITDSITIILPQQTSTQQQFWVDGSNAVLNIANTITAAGSNERLSNGGEQHLPFQFGEAGGLLNFGLSTKGDAVWGNDVDEQYSTTDKTCKYYNDISGYHKAVANALNNTKYRKIVLSGDLDLENSKYGFGGTLNIRRAVNLDLNGYDIEGNVVISTTDAVDRMSITSSRGASEIKGRTDNVAGDATVIVNAPKVMHFDLGNPAVSNVTVSANGSSNIGLKVEEIWSQTFNNYATIKGVEITGNAGFANWATITNGIKISAASAVTLEGDYTGSNLTGGIKVTGGATVTISKENTTLNNVTIEISDKDAKVVVPAGLNVTDNAPSIIVENVKVTLEGDATVMQQMVDNKITATGDNGKVVKYDSDEKKDVELATSATKPTNAQEVINKVADTISGAAIVDGNPIEIAYNVAKGTVAIDLPAKVTEGITAATNSLDEGNIVITAAKNDWFEIDATSKKLVLKKVNDVTADTTITVKLTIEDTTAGSTAIKTQDVKIKLKKA